MNDRATGGFVSAAAGSVFGAALEARKSVALLNEVFIGRGAPFRVALRSGFEALFEDFFGTALEGFFDAVFEFVLSTGFGPVFLAVFDPALETVLDDAFERVLSVVFDAGFGMILGVVLGADFVAFLVKDRLCDGDDAVEIAGEQNALGVVARAACKSAGRKADGVASRLARPREDMFACAVRLYTRG